MIISDILHKAGVIWRFCHDYILIIVLVYNIYICDYKLWIYDYETNAQTGRHIQVGGKVSKNPLRLFKFHFNNNDNNDNNNNDNDNDNDNNHNNNNSNNNNNNHDEKKSAIPKKIEMGVYFNL